MDFWPTFIFEKWVLAHFCSGLISILVGFVGLIRTILLFWPTFGPLLKIKLGHEKPSIYAGLRTFGPLSHSLSYLIVIKSLINIENRTSKSGFLGQTEKTRDSDKKGGTSVMGWIISILLLFGYFAAPAAGVDVLIAAGLFAIAGSISFAADTIFKNNKNN